MTHDALLFAYATVTVAGVAAAALYSEHRRKTFAHGPSRDRLFRCEKCSMVYTDDADVDLSRCPQCGQNNEPFEF